MRTTHNTAPSQPTRAGGFNLIELMVATALMAFILSIVFALSNNVLNSWNRASSQITSHAEAQMALDFLAQDLQAMVIRNDGRVWLKVEYGDTQKSGGSVTNSLPRQARIQFFAPVTDQPDEGADGIKLATGICAVLYSTYYQDPFNGITGVSSVPSFGLYRRVTSAEITFNNWLNPKDSGGNAITAVDGLLSAFNTNYATNLTANNLPDEFLSNHIVDFRMVFSRRHENVDPNDGSITINIAPITEYGTPGGVPKPFIYQNGVDELGVDPDDGSTTYTALSGSIVYVDISLTVLSERGAQLFDALESSTTLGEVGINLNRDDIVREHSSTYSRRVYLGGLF